jgi:hypothetical protein
VLHSIRGCDRPDANARKRKEEKKIVTEGVDERKCGLSNWAAPTWGKSCKWSVREKQSWDVMFMYPPDDASFQIERWQPESLYI